MSQALTSHCGRWQIGHCGILLRSLHTPTQPWGLFLAQPRDGAYRGQGQGLHLVSC